MRPGLRALGWTVVVLLLVVPSLRTHEGEAAPRPSSAAQRLLGPIASAVAGVQWVRVHEAMRAGRTDVALARAQLALELDPGATDGWILLAAHLAFQRASAEREPDPVRRLAWIRAGLHVARRGERMAAEPALLARWQGLVLAKLAQEDEPVPWPGGGAALWLEAAEHFERSARLGLVEGDELAASARARALSAA